mgnify:CR=1 FL=1
MKDYNLKKMNYLEEKILIIGVYMNLEMMVMEDLLHLKNLLIRLN